MTSQYAEYAKYKTKVEMLQYNPDISWVKIEYEPMNKDHQELFIMTDMNVGKSGVLRVPDFVNVIVHGDRNSVTPNIKIVHKNNVLQTLTFLLEDFYAKSIDLQEFDFSHVRSLSKLIHSINNIQSIKLPTLSRETSRNILQASQMFSQTTLSGDLDLQNIDFSGLIQYNRMFSYSGIESIKLGKFGQKYCKRLQNFIIGCYYLKSVEIDELDVQGFRVISSLVNNCPNLERLVIHTVGKLESPAHFDLIQGCPKLKYIDIGELQSLIDTAT